MDCDCATCVPTPSVPDIYKELALLRKELAELRTAHTAHVLSTHWAPYYTEFRPFIGYPHTTGSVMSSAVDNNTPNRSVSPI